MATFAETITDRLKTQDNRITAEPIFVVQQKRRVFGMDLAYSDNIAWMDDEGHQVTGEDAENMEKIFQENGVEPDDYRRVAYIDTWGFVSCFLTEQGAKDFIEAQKHNMHEPRIYVDSGHNNSEWKALRAYFLNQ